jgi:spermidine/putrescine transport system permease protein
MIERVRPKAPRALQAILPFVLIALYLPLAVMIAGSFKGWTLQWYVELFQDETLFEALLRSVCVATSAAFLSTILAVCAALALEKFVFAGRWPMRILSTISLMLPELVLSLSLLCWFSVLHWELSLATVVVAHITLVLPFAILILASRLTSMDAAVEDAARDLGAGEFSVLTRITLPLLKPAIISAFTLSFLLSFDDFLVTYYTNGAGHDTLPVKLYALMKSGLSPKVQALSSLMLFASVALALLLLKHRPKDGQGA